MDFEWVAIALTDVTWLSLAFILGFLARQVHLPPLVGFLATGFVLNFFGIIGGESLQKLADLGITLLLFTVGLKLDTKVLIRPQVFSLMLAFALSFSSTVFVVKSLEEKGEMSSFHGQIAIGILIMQDLAAVIFLAASTGKLPTYWALFLFLLIPLRPVFYFFLKKSGHGELLILYALVLALGSAEIFELSGVKDDLGALFMGILISSHPKSKEMAKAMLGFKDLFLVGFFLSIGLSGKLSLEVLIIGLLLVPFILIKSSLFFLLMTRFQLRARTSLLASVNLTNYSEFGLIVAAIGVSNQWLDPEWLIAIAIAVSVSFMIAAIISSVENKLYSQKKELLLKFQSKQRLHDDQILSIQDESIAIDIVMGIDSDIKLVAQQNRWGEKFYLAILVMQIFGRR